MAGLRSPSRTEVTASRDFVAIATGHVRLPWTLQQLAQNPLPSLVKAQALPLWQHKERGEGLLQETHRWTVSAPLPGRMHGTRPFHYTLGRTAGKSRIRCLLPSWEGMRGTYSSPIYTAASQGNGKTGPGWSRRHGLCREHANTMGWGRKLHYSLYVQGTSLTPQEQCTAPPPPTKLLDLHGCAWGFSR